MSHPVFVQQEPAGHDKTAIGLAIVAIIIAIVIYTQIPAAYVPPAAAAADTWHNATLAAGWTAYGSGYGAPQYTKGPDNMVHLRGLVNPGPGNTIFTLPPGYRPTTGITGGSGLIFLTGGNDQWTELRIYTAGNIDWVAGQRGWVSLDGISFSTV